MKYTTFIFIIICTALSADFAMLTAAQEFTPQPQPAPTYGTYCEGLLYNVQGVANGDNDQALALIHAFKSAYPRTNINLIFALSLPCLSHILADRNCWEALLNLYEQTELELTSLDVINGSNLLHKLALASSKPPINNNDTSIIHLLTEKLLTTNPEFLNYARPGDLLTPMVAVFLPPQEQQYDSALAYKMFVAWKQYRESNGEPTYISNSTHRVARRIGDLAHIYRAAQQAQREPVTDFMIAAAVLERFQPTDPAPAQPNYSNFIDQGVAHTTTEGSYFPTAPHLPTHQVYSTPSRHSGWIGGPNPPRPTTRQPRDTQSAK